jgi:lipopolysaccharide transport system permease protein
MKAVLSVVGARELLWNFTLRELRTKYRRSVLGWTWSMLNPLATVAIYGFVFGVVFGAEAPTGDPSGIDSFALFLLCGLIPWNFFALVNNLGIGAITSNAGLVRRVAFPREVLVFANVMHACVQFGIELALLCVVLLIAGSPLLPWLPLIVLTGVLLALFSAGFALALSAIAVYFRDMTYLWGIALQVWFFATPIVYPPSFITDNGDIPEWAKDVLQANPMAGFVRVFRRLLYDGGAPGATTWFGLLATSLVSLAIGWWIFLKLAPRFAEEV